MNIFLRPIESDSRPPSSSRLPNASAYPVTTHCRPASEKAKSRWAVGSAMFTMVASSTTINCAIASTTRAHHRPVGTAGAGPDAVLGRSASVVIYPPVRRKVVSTSRFGTGGGPVKAQGLELGSASVARVCGNFW